MAQEFIIKSQDIEDKINQLLPSQGGAQPGVDFSASTMVIPIVDLTETAEGSSLRQDLQTSLSFTQQTAFSVRNTTSTLVNTTGYYRVIGTGLLKSTDNSVVSALSFILNDGTTDKTVYGMSQGQTYGSGFLQQTFTYDFSVKLEAGHSLKASSNEPGAILIGSTRQIADLQGNLINP
jgi:hypothetical protein